MNNDSRRLVFDRLLTFLLGKTSSSRVACWLLGRGHLVAMLFVVAQRTVLCTVTEPFQWNACVIAMMYSTSGVVAIEPVSAILQRTVSHRFERVGVLRVFLFAGASRLGAVDLILAQDTTRCALLIL